MSSESLNTKLKRSYLDGSKHITESGLGYFLPNHFHVFAINSSHHYL